MELIAIIILCCFLGFIGCSSDKKTSIANSGGDPDPIVDVPAGDDDDDAAAGDDDDDAAAGDDDDDSTRDLTGASILFESAEPESIAIKGTGGVGGRVEHSRVTFIIVDANQDPVSGIDVNFTLSSENGGLALVNDTDTTGDDGKVSTIVIAGTAATTYEVTAEASDLSISTVSENLVVSTCLPDADSFTLSVTSHNPECLTQDGIEVTATVRLADHFNNPVPEGIAVYFTAEAGSIDPYCLTDSNGSCFVTWRSQGERPADGLLTIMATTIGEEYFFDVGSDGQYTAADLAVWDVARDLGEVYLDVDNDGAYDDGIDPYRDYDADGAFDDVGNGIYNGVLCSDELEASDGCTKDLLEVAAYNLMVMSGKDAYVDRIAGGILVYDENGNSMPGGTTIKIAPQDTAATQISHTSFTVGNVILPMACYFDITGAPEFYVDVTTPYGVLTRASCDAAVCN